MIAQTNPQLERTLGAIVDHVDQFDAVYKLELGVAVPSRWTW